MRPFDQFMAANMVLVVTLQFLFCFLAQVETKNRSLVLFYGVPNSLVVIMLSLVHCFLVLWKLIISSLYTVLWVLFSFFLRNTKKLPLS